ncbi:MAG: Gfo/Idh/MocA family oxidoreductase [Candidatus Diapherotrites archaeon]
MKTVRFGLIGCGKISKKHITAIKNTQNAELTAVCDLKKELAEKTGKENNVPWFASYKEMLEKADIDAVSIITPSGLHWEPAVDSANAGKHVVVEKPMALTLKDADKVIAACKKNNVKLFEVKQNRFNKPIVKLKEAIDSGKFKKFVIATARMRWTRKQDYYDAVDWRGTWAMDGGVISNQANHHIDLLQWLMGDIESVMCKTATRLADIEADDTAVAIIKFSNGALGIIEATTATRPKDLEGSISVLGEGGTVIVGGFSADKLDIWQFEDGAYKIDEDFKQNPNVFAYNHAKFFENVVDCILHDKKAVIDGNEARKSIELINALYESAASGREIFLKFEPKHSKLGGGK